MASKVTVENTGDTVLLAHRYREGTDDQKVEIHPGDSFTLALTDGAGLIVVEKKP